MPNLVMQIVCVLALQFVFRRPLAVEASYKLAVVLILILDQPQRNCQITSHSRGFYTGKLQNSAHTWFACAIDADLLQDPCFACRQYDILLPVLEEPAGKTTVTTIDHF